MNFITKMFSVFLLSDTVTSASTKPNVTTDVTTAASLTAAPHTGFHLLLDKVQYSIMVPMVYFALIFCLVAIILRVAAILRAPSQPYTLRIFPASKKPKLKALADTFTMPQIRKHNPLFWGFLMIFHLSFLLLILGHLDILPNISFLSESSRHMLGVGLVGVGVTLPLFYFLFRRFRSPNREITVPADYLLLILILFLCLFGDLMSWGNSWTANGFVMTKQDFAQYFSGLVNFTFSDPRQVLHGSHYHFVVIHVLLANIFFIVLPFSKVVHAFLAFPINVLRRK